ncbi:MAG: Crp/Fnr family transcriptional regulator [Chthonomonadales bacterium]
MAQKPQDMEVRSVPILAAIPADTLERFLPRFRVQVFLAGEQVYHAGDRADAIHFLLHGRVKILRTSADGRQVIVSFYGRGDFIGCCTLLKTARWPCTAVAVETTKTASLTQQDLYEMLTAVPQLSAAMLQAVAARLRDADRRLQNLALDPAGSRVIAALLELDDRFGISQPDGSRVIRQRVTRMELAEMAGTTLETASRTMSRLKRKGIVISQGRNIRLLSRAQLEQMQINLL